MCSSSQTPSTGTALSNKRTVVNLGLSNSKRVRLEQKRLNPLTAFVFPNSGGHASTSPLESSAATNIQEKGKTISSNLHDQSKDDRLWVDIYEPKTEADLAVHTKKVDDVRRWLHEALTGGPSGKLSKYRRILVLTGPAGTGKTSTLRVIAREIGFEIIEWRSAGETATSGAFEDSAYESLMSKFETFLNRASSCHNIVQKSNAARYSLCLAKPSMKPHVILLEELPNVLHPGIQSQFHSVLQAFVSSPQTKPPVPLVVILSDSGIRAETGDEFGASKGYSHEQDKVVDVRSVFPRELLNGPYVTLISFNPVAPTLMRRALQSLLTAHFESAMKSLPSKEVMDVVVASSNGDIRSAIMALQFACVIKLGNSKGKGRKNMNGVLVLEAATRREQSLFLFHLLGKVFYNKRKGDPVGASSTAKDIQKERDLDANLRDPPELPKHLREHTRRASRVDINMLHANSPIDSSLLSLYIHQNYTQFCDDITNCVDIMEVLSWMDSSGGEMWSQSNPHHFHFLTLGTLHALPTPVARRSQKIYKPNFFDSLKKEKDAWEGVRDVKNWLENHSRTPDNNVWHAFGWSKSNVAMELGGILRVRDATSSHVSAPLPPFTHRLFSQLSFAKEDEGSRKVLGEDGLAHVDEVREGFDNVSSNARRKPEEQGKGWLDSDDIEDF